MCAASLQAYEDLLTTNVLSSAAVMTPCPWFLATAFSYRHREVTVPHIDLGVHLTLTAEWENYRWGPLSTNDPGSGLLDGEGYFHHQCHQVHEQAQPEAVRRELVAQIERALAAGIDITHIDSHMLCLVHPKFLPHYADLARTYRVPAFLPTPQAFRNQLGGMLGAAESEEIAAQLDKLQEEGFPLLDHAEMMSLDQPENRLEEARQKLEGLPPGISYFLIHPSTDTDELRSITPDWRCRVADYELFRSPEWADVVRESGVKVIGWRGIRDAMRI